MTSSPLRVRGLMVTEAGFEFRNRSSVSTNSLVYNYNQLVTCLNENRKGKGKDIIYSHLSILQVDRYILE